MTWCRGTHHVNSDVEEGNLVLPRPRIGDVGSTGRSTGPHLRFEVRPFGVAQNPARFLALTGLRVRDAPANGGAPEGVKAILPPC